MAAATGLVSATPVVAAPVQAEPSPGVPCLSLMQDLAASPPDLGESLHHAAAALAEQAAPPPVAAPAEPAV
ncbi:hypothetical protein E4P42_21375, partial [Mycobacterium sp. PS03-16]